MSQKERIKKALGISVYPWSSDESNSDEPATQAAQQNIEPAETSDQAGTSATVPSESPSGTAVEEPKPDTESLRRLRNIYWKMLNLPRHMLSSEHLNRRELSEMRRIGPNSPISSIERVIAINRVSDWNRLGVTSRSSSGLRRNRGNRDSAPVEPNCLNGSNVLEVESSSDDNEPQGNATATSTSRMVRRSGRGVMLAGTSQPAMSIERARSERRATSLSADGEQMRTSTLEDENEAAPAEGSAAAPSPQSEGDHSENEEDSDEGPTRSPEANAGEAVTANAETVESEPRQANDEENEDDGGDNSDDEQRRPRKRRRIVSQETAVALRKVNERLLRVLECPVCLEAMAPPLRQCGRGHLLCSRCCARLHCCPLCRTPLSAVRNRAMEAVAELLRYPCRHGCGRARRLRTRDAHEANCAARAYRCPAAPCADGACVALAQLPAHLQARHPALLRRSPRHTARVPLGLDTRENLVLMLGPELFHLRLDLERRRGLHVRVAYLGPVARAQRFAYEVSLEGEQMRKLVYTRVTHSDLECSSVILRREDCFHLPLTQASNYLRAHAGNGEANGGYLELTVQVMANEQSCINVDESES